MRLTKSVNNNAIYSAFVHRRNKLHHLQGYLYQTSVLVYKKMTEKHCYSPKVCLTMQFILFLYNTENKLHLLQGYL